MDPLRFGPPGSGPELGFGVLPMLRAKHVVAATIRLCRGISSSLGWDVRQPATASATAATTAAAAAASGSCAAAPTAAAAQLAAGEAGEGPAGVPQGGDTQEGACRTGQVKIIIF
jgi:hypothetical protein